MDYLIDPDVLVPIILERDRHSKNPRIFWCRMIDSEADARLASILMERSRALSARGVRDGSIEMSTESMRAHQEFIAGCIPKIQEPDGTIIEGHGAVLGILKRLLAALYDELVRKLKGSQELIEIEGKDYALQS